MSSIAPIVSVIIATYNSGEDLDKLVVSLDAQTLPQDQFEVVLVDDGSTNGTFERLLAFASTRPNYHAERIENSGWPSRPRNIGMEKARGEYVTFMDHDDALFPDGLRAITEYAMRTGADVVIPHEEKTNDMWMFLAALDGGNLDDIKTSGGLRRMYPMVPHKLYRRSLLLDNGVEFPDRPRALWEDQYINVGAYRHAEKIALLADTPYYHWRSTTTNTSKTFSPRRREYWQRLDEILNFSTAALNRPADRDSLNIALENHIRVRMVDKFVGQWNPKRWESWVAGIRSRKLLKKYLTQEVVELMPVRHRIHAALLERGKFEEMGRFQAFDRSVSERRSLRRFGADSGGLHGEFVVEWGSGTSETDFVREDSGRLQLVVPDEIRRHVPEAILDVTDALSLPTIRIAMRNRFQPVTWQPEQAERVPEVVRGESGRVIVPTVSDFTLDPTTVACGNPIEGGAWNIRARTELFGFVRKSAVPYEGQSVPFAANDHLSVAYASNAGTLTLDNSGALRTFATDGLEKGAISGVAPELTVPLARARGRGTGERDAGLFALPSGQDPIGTIEENRENGLDARVVNADGQLSLTVHLELPAGEYDLWADRNGTLTKTVRQLDITGDGTATLR